MRVKAAGHQPRDGGFTHAGRAPQDAAVRLAGLKRHPQRHTLAQQMLLANYLAQGLRAQTFSQRNIDLSAVDVGHGGNAQSYWRLTSAPGGGVN